MKREFPKQAFAAREAHEAVLELKKFLDDAAKTIHAAELESFRAAIVSNHDDAVRRSLQAVIDRLDSPVFEFMVTTVRVKLQTAVSA